jgi:hypothetical protein
MSDSDDRPVEETFQLGIGVPAHVRHDRHLLGEWLDSMAREINRSDVVIKEDDPFEPGGGGDVTDWVPVTMLLRGCGTKSPDDFHPGDDDHDGDDDVLG